MSRRDELLAKALGIRSTKDIDAPEVAPAEHKARSGQGSYARRQAMEDRIAELESKLKEAGGSALSSRLPVGAIAPNPWQPRRVFKEDELNKLAESIKDLGLLQPVIVRRVQNLDTFELIAGERRLRAHQLLGEQEIKAIVIEAADEDMAALALAENIDRQDLSAYEIAIAIKNAESAFPSRKEMAKSLGMQRSDLYRYMSFFQLPDFIREDLDQNPRLLGRDASEAIVAVINSQGISAVDAVSRIWTRVRTGQLDQGKIAPMVKSLATHGDASAASQKTERDIKKLFVGKEQAGSITRDPSQLTIKIRAAALTPDKENELRKFVEGLFSQ